MFLAKSNHILLVDKFARGVKPLFSKELSKRLFLSTASILERKDNDFCPLAGRSHGTILPINKR
jgi:hypothetical protein